MSKTYTQERLKTFAIENKIEFLKDYSNESLRCDFILEGKCTNKECAQTFKKSFRHLLKNGSWCFQCTQNKNGRRECFNWQKLNAYCVEKQIELHHDYSVVKLGATKEITGVCETLNCKNDFMCKFRNLVQFGAFCKECFYKKKNELTKESNKQKYGVESVSQVKEIRQKAEETMLAKYGAKYTTQSNELFTKMKENNKAKYGVEYTQQLQEIREKSKATILAKYGVENILQNAEIKQKMKNTVRAKYGVEHVSQNAEIKEKIKATVLEKYGVAHVLQSTEVREKGKNTILSKFGVEFVSQSHEIQQKIKNTNVQKYGVESPFQHQESRQKGVETLLNKYGVVNISQNDSIKLKKQKTMMQNFGVTSPFQLEETKKNNRISQQVHHDAILMKRKQTSLIKYGVEHPAQNAVIADKSSKNAYKMKAYTFPSGRIDMVQGNEHLALDELLHREKVSETDIVTQRSKVPVCWWQDENGKRHRYFVDIYIPSQNRCIEVKSTWTAEKKKDCIFLKQDALQKAGFKCEIWVYDQKNNRVQCHR